ncbi:MAG: hypothetical protein KAX44_03430 [Candidatus Brocadiae bacterium]|nr:hypothetical protein [Candidatus Brocadiia bacterium]
MVDFDLQVECPFCGAAFKVPRIRSGREERCPVCRATVAVPEAGTGREVEAVEVETAPGGTVAAVEPTPPDLAGLGGGVAALVCSAREQRINPLDAGPVIAAFTGKTPLDARRQVMRGMGILAEGLRLDSAREMVEVLERKGVEAFAMPAELVPAVERKLPLVCIYGADERALHVQPDREGTVRSVPWETVAAGICTQHELAGRAGRQHEAREKYTVGSIGMARIRIRSARPRPREERPEVQMTLALSDRAGRAYALAFTEHQVRYGYLEERLKPSGRQNLVLLLADVLKWAGRGFFPGRFRAAAEGRLAGIPKVVGKLDRNSYLRWAMCCAAARGLFRPVAP